MKNTMIGVGVAIAVLIVLFGGYKALKGARSVVSTPVPDIQTTSQTTPTIPPDAMSATDTSSSTDSAMTGQVKEFTVEGSSFKYVPATLAVNKGDTVKITFKNSGGMHDFVIDELNVKTKTISSGAQEVVQFTASQAGTFKYYCSVGNHRAMGMEGTLTVQ